jgi:hypothetical protein
MTKELEAQSQQELAQLAYEDVLVSFNSLCEQYGVRAVLASFRDAYPEMYEEVVVQINRLPPQRQVAALLR